MRYFIIWRRTDWENKYNMILYKEHILRGKPLLKVGNVDCCFWGVTAEEIGQLMGGN